MRLISVWAKEVRLMARNSRASTQVALIIRRVNRISLVTHFCRMFQPQNTHSCVRSGWEALRFPLKMFAGAEPASDIRDWDAIQTWAGDLVSRFDPPEQY